MIASSVQTSKAAFAMSRESWQIFLIFALATGLAFEVLSFGFFHGDSRPLWFFMTVLCLLGLVGIFFLARNRFFLGRYRATPLPTPAMTDRTRAQSALVITVFFVAGLMGIWFGGSQLFHIFFWSVSLTASISLGREYADR